MKKKPKVPTTVGGWHRPYLNHRKEYAAAEAEVESAKKRLDEIGRPRWKNGLIEMLAEALSDEVKAAEFEVSGPFGLCQDCTIRLRLPGKRKSLYAKFRPTDGLNGIELVREIHRAAWSIGAMSGVGVRVEKIPPSMKLTELIKKFKPE